MINHDLFKFSERLMRLLKRNTVLAFFLEVAINQILPQSFAKIIDLS